MGIRATEGHRTWLFDLAHGNLSEPQIMQGFIRYYVLEGCLLANVQDDLVFRTAFGSRYVEQAMESLREVLEKMAWGGGK